MCLSTTCGAFEHTNVSISPGGGGGGCNIPREENLPMIMKKEQEWHAGIMFHALTTSILMLWNRNFVTEGVSIKLDFL